MKQNWFIRNKSMPGLRTKLETLLFKVAYRFFPLKWTHTINQWEFKKYTGVEQR